MTVSQRYTATQRVPAALSQPRWYPVRFKIEDQAPRKVFKYELNQHFTSFSNPYQGPIYTCGACSNNDTPWITGGYAFVYKHKLASSLEDIYRPESSSSTIEMPMHKLSLSLIIATDSAYVIDGTTRYIRKWEKNGWKNTKGGPVAKQDLCGKCSSRKRVC